MKKIITAVLLWTALCASAFPQNASDFTVDANGVITKYNGFNTDVVIPATINGKKITAIGKEAFQKANLTSVTIPNSVTSIGDGAFSDNQLTSVTFQGTITAIQLAPDAFSGLGDLRAKYLAGGRGTYTRPNADSRTWTKQ